MNNAHAVRPKRTFLLIDDDEYSARFFVRQLHKHAGSPDQVDVKWINVPELGIQKLEQLANERATVELPDMVIVDLKASSAANLDFIRAVAPLVQAIERDLVVFVAPNEAERHDALLGAGAVAVFERHGHVDAFGVEMKSLLRLSTYKSHAA